MDNLHAVKGQKAPTSYGRLRKKYLACKVELAELKGVDYEKTSQGFMIKRRRTFSKLETTSGWYHDTKARLQMLASENAALKTTQEQERRQLEELILRNEQLDLGHQVCCTVMGELREKITTLSNANDLLTREVQDVWNVNAILTRQVREHEAGVAWQRKLERANERAVCQAFGWTKLKVDPILLRAACGFWSGTVHCSTDCEDTTDMGDSRVSFKRRMEIWTNLTCHGFHGKVMESLEKQFFQSKKFNVVEICRKSDVESQFNAGALQSMANCESGKKKYTRGLLCSDATLRRTQKKVHKLAEGLGFSSLPTVEEGNVWCWGDADGNFKTAVNRYVYEIYVKARCDDVTKEKPWKLAITGDLARVNFRGKAITIGGPKQVDPRLPCQAMKGKTSNQSRDMYTPAVAGYVDEGYIMKYFNEMVESFREIETQSYCVAQGIRHTVYIEVNVVADMAFLQKYLGRGGGSHACTNFCFFCSVSSKYRHQGYPGGCRKCRKAGTVYDETTGCQQCLHHEECTPDFLEWQTVRKKYLEETVKPRITKCARPFYEDKQGLIVECLKRCTSDVQRKVVEKKKSIAALEKWLKADGRTRDGCDLSCNLHTGVRIASMAVVAEDLRLRNVRHATMTDTEKRHTLELLLREEEELMRLQMYFRDEHFTQALENDSDYHNKLKKTLLDVLHMPMRTNEKVLTLLYEEVMQGAHKAQASSVLNELTPIIRRLGELGDLWTHKFDEKNTKIIKKFKLPYDQSKKIFAIEQLEGLREAVNVAIHPSNVQLRQDWMMFLSEYVHMNALLHRSDDYSADEINVLEQHIDRCYKLLVTRIGGAERGVTNYFHYLGSGHVMWMIRRHGNLWRFCNEGAEHLNALVSKRYNLFNNKGGNKKGSTGGPKRKCLPFEVLGSWMGRLSMWHTGLAVEYFNDAAWDQCAWTGEDMKIEWCNEMERYIDTKEALQEVISDSDSDWEIDDYLNAKTSRLDEEMSDRSDTDDDYYSDNDIEDFTWLKGYVAESTWKITDEGLRTSTRLRYQQRPLL